MKSEHLDHLVREVKGLHSAAAADASGTVMAQSRNSEGDIPCAVGVICRGQLEEMGALLGAARVRDWAVVSPGMNVYYIADGDHCVVALGQYDDKPTKTSEKMVSLLPKAR